MYKNVKPTIILSNCLEYRACRYNGEVIPNNFVRILEPYVNYVKVCPELEIGMGVPRDPIKIVSMEGKERLIQPASGMDYTESMTGFADKYISSIKAADGFILKSKSPSCGIADVKLHGTVEKGSTIGRTSGFFARAILQKYDGLAIEDESRLLNFNIRENFLTKIFAFARFRKLLSDKNIADLITFQAENKFLLMSYNQTKMRQLGRVIATHDKSNIDKIFDEYTKIFQNLFTGISRKKSNINVFMHAQGYFSRFLTSSEKHFFLNLLEKYKNNMVPVSGIIVLLKSWILKYNEKYLMNQTFFNPYPEELMNVTDSGKGRELQ